LSYFLQACCHRDRYLTFCDVSDVSGEPLRLGLSRGAPLPVVIADPELRPERAGLKAFPPFVVATAFPEASPRSAPACASANVEAKVSIEAKTIVAILIVRLLHRRDNRDLI
jgi:hypothetical protein